MSAPLGFLTGMYRVGFVGSHSVGKTTQLEAVASYFRLPAITEVVRQVAAEWGISNVSQVSDRAGFQWEILDRQRLEEDRAGLFISDRSTVDNAAYFLLYVAPELPEEEVARYVAHARAHAARYTHLVYFPIAWDHVTPDGFRDTDPAERRKVDALMQVLLTDWGLWHKTLTVTTDDIQHGAGARATQIAEWLRGHQVVL